MKYDVVLNLNRMAEVILLSACTNSEFTIADYADDVFWSYTCTDFSTVATVMKDDLGCEEH